MADDGFDRWLEKLKERARICGWNDEQKLDKTAAEVFRMLPEEECSNFEKAVESLRKRFRPGTTWSGISP